ncbi:MAG: hypothetical protein JHC98_01060 [Thermoleophilaceae bacterium]|nr:hypothetical protein [Thermoleophilaceae bacterium]
MLTPLLAHRSSNRLLALIVAVLAICAVAPTGASAAPEDSVAGAGKKWVSGSLMQISGTNCSILGGSYSETMVSAISGYGGAASGSVVRIGDEYWASVMISIPGNPCGTGSTIVSTDLSFPKGTSYDPARQIRCFGIPRNGNTWSELTGGSWDMRPIGINAYGPYCPTSTTPSASGAGIGFGYRALVSGQMYQLFVPVKSTQQLLGAAANPVDEFRWTITATGTYNNDSTYVWTNVFPSGSSAPYLYYARNPSIVPFWDKNQPAGTENRIEIFGNLYSNFQPGSFCWDMYAGPTATGTPVVKCEDLGGEWGSTVTNADDTWLITGPGPNGGAVPFYFNPPGYGQTFTFRYRFTYNSGSTTIYSTPITFTTLSGPDEDGDGVANNGADQCPTVKGNLPNGCQPSLAANDADGDGVIGADDICPEAAQASTTNGCPAFKTGFGKLPKLKRKALVKGTKIKISCTIDSNAKADITVSKAVAKKLKLKVKKGAKSVSIGGATGPCKASGGGALKLKLSSKAKKAVLKSKKAVSTTITLTTSRSGLPNATSSVKAKLG